MTNVWNLFRAWGLFVISLVVLTAAIFQPIKIPPPPAPFDVPAFVPDEATKIRALKRAYELVGGITDAWGSVDVSKEESVTGDQPDH
jgi:hypothetical protein